MHYMDSSGFVTLEYWIKFDKYPLSLRKERLGKKKKKKQELDLVSFRLPTLVMTSFL